MLVWDSSVSIHLGACFDTFHLERAYRRKGLAFEALELFLGYATRRNQEPPGLALSPYQLVVRIGGSNSPSQSLFKRLGFIVSKEVPVFDEVEMRWHWDETGLQPELSEGAVRSLWGNGGQIVYYP